MFLCSPDDNPYFVLLSASCNANMLCGTACHSGLLYVLQVWSRDHVGPVATTRQNRRTLPNRARQDKLRQSRFCERNAGFLICETPVYRGLKCWLALETLLLSFPLCWHKLQLRSMLLVDGDMDFGLGSSGGATALDSFDSEYFGVDIAPSNDYLNIDPQLLGFDLNPSPSTFYSDLSSRSPSPFRPETPQDPLDGNYNMFRQYDVSSNASVAGSFGYDEYPPLYARDG